MAQKDHTRLVVVSLLTVLASIQLQELAGSPDPPCLLDDPVPGCQCYQYLDTDECKNCTDCASKGQLTLNHCSSQSDSTCMCDMLTQYYNTTTRQCQNCTVCGSYEKQVSKCTVNEDTKCVQRCLPHQYYVPAEDRCVFDCNLCTFGCVKTGTSQCQCIPSICYHNTDLLCKNNLCDASTTESSESTRSFDSSANDLPTWGFGLISIGVVLGIVAFSVGSMILSFCTRRSNSRTEEVIPTVEYKAVLRGTHRYPNVYNCPALFQYPLDKYGHLSNSAQTATGSGSRANSLRVHHIRSNSFKSELSKSENVMPI